MITDGDGKMLIKATLAEHSILINTLIKKVDELEKLNSPKKRPRKKK